jgi:hypothetical protein
MASCPYCDKRNADGGLIDIAKRNAEHYGTSEFYFRCTRCSKIFAVYVVQQVKVMPSAKVFNDKIVPSFGG